MVRRTLNKDSLASEACSVTHKVGNVVRWSASLFVMDPCFTALKNEEHILPAAQAGRKGHSACHGRKGCGKISRDVGRNKKSFVFFITRQNAKKETPEPPFSAFMMLRGDGYSALAAAGTCQSMPKVQELSLTAGAH